MSLYVSHHINIQHINRFTKQRNNKLTNSKLVTLVVLQILLSPFAELVAIE